MTNRTPDRRRPIRAASMLASTLAIAPVLTTAVTVPPAPKIAVPLVAAPVVSRVFADGTDVVIAWYGVRGAAAYEIVRAPDPQQSPTTVARLSDSSLGYRDKQAGPGPFYYQVVAVGADGSRLASAWTGFNTKSATLGPGPTSPVAPLSSPAGAGTPQRGMAPTAAPTAAPAASALAGVTGLSVTATTATTATMSWTAPAGASGFRVMGGMYGTSYATLATLAAGTTSYTATSLAPATSYGFTVIAFYSGPVVASASTDGAVAGPVKAETRPGLPPASLIARQAPSASLTYILQQATQGAAVAAANAVDVQLEWPAAAEAGGYLVFRDGTPLVQSNAPVTATTFTDAGVATGTHTYSVASVFKTAANGFAEGQLSGLPSVAVPVAYGFYRVVLEQVIVNRPGGKDAGAFLTADRRLLNAGDATLSASAPQRTWTYGVRTPVIYPDRIQARVLAGDALPPPGVPCTTKDQAHLCLPLEVYSGPLVKDLVGVYITARAWYTGNIDDGMRAALDNRYRNELDPKLVASLQQAHDQAAAAAAQLRTAPQSGFASASLDDLLPPANPVLGLELSPVKTAFPIVPVDRPVGRTTVSDDPLRNEEWTRLTEQPIALGYDGAERLVSGPPLNPALQPGQIAINFTDQFMPNGTSLTLTFRVQRL
jgi:hypothetical protein